MSELKSAVGHAVVVPGTPFEVTCRGIYIGTGGDVSVKIGGVDCVYKNLPNAGYLAVAATVVNVSGTTADDMVVQF